MEKYRLLCSCGHAVDVSTSYQSSSRLFRHRLRVVCPECHQHGEESQLISRDEIPEDGELARLYGSAYQLVWARDIRKRLVIGFKRCIAKYPYDTQQTITEILFDLVNQRTEAGWWVENEYDPLGALTRGCSDTTKMAILDMIRFHLRSEPRKSGRHARSV